MIFIPHFPTDGRCPECGAYMVLKLDGRIVCPVCGYSSRVEIGEKKIVEFKETEGDEENTLD